MKKFLIVVGVIFGLLAALFILRKDHTVSKEVAIEMCAFPNSKFVKWNGGDVHYVEFGDKSKEQILMIHGFGGSLHNFKSLFELMQDDYYILAIDLPGFALSDIPNIETLGTSSYNEAYGLFFEFIVSEFELKNFHIIGNSLGGWMAWETAYVMPENVKSLTLLASAGYEIDKVTKNATAWLKTWWADALFKKGMPLYVNKSNMKRIFYDQSKVTEEGLTKQYYSINKQGNFPFMLTLATTGEFPNTAKIAEIKTPTLVIWGTDDLIIPSYHAEMFQNDMENCKVVIFENCGHVPQIELPNETYTEIVKFYEEVNQRNTIIVVTAKEQDITEL